jgi:ABC-2 type transport system ATP-binding protein
MLRLHNLTKRYGELVAVDGLSLSLARGEIFGLLGPNGAGKTTTVHMAMGLIEPDGGSVEVDGAGPPSLPAARTRLGIAPQTLSLYEPLTGEENLRFFGTVYGLGGATLAGRVRWALDFVGLADRARDRVEVYSGGMKRRLNLAAALMHDPDLLLLDEPTVGVDPQSRNRLFENVLALKAQGRTVLYTTHYMEEAARLCDRVAIVDHGRLLACDTVDRLIAAHAGPPTLVVDSSGETVRLETAQPLVDLNRLAATRPIDAFHLERPTLEQVFLNLTGRALRD